MLILIIYIIYIKLVLRCLTRACLLLLFQLRKSLKKSRRPALGGYESSTDPAHRLLLSDTDGSGKENQAQDKHVLLSSDDEDFDKCMFGLRNTLGLHVFLHY